MVAEIKKYNPIEIIVSRTDDDFRFLVKYTDKIKKSDSTIYLDNEGQVMSDLKSQVESALKTGRRINFNIDTKARDKLQRPEELEEMVRRQIEDYSPREDG